MGVPSPPPISVTEILYVGHLCSLYALCWASMWHPLAWWCWHDFWLAMGCQFHVAPSRWCRQSKQLEKLTRENICNRCEKKHIRETRELKSHKGWRALCWSQCSTILMVLAPGEEATLERVYLQPMWTLVKNQCKTSQCNVAPSWWCWQQKRQRARFIRGH